VNFLVLCWALVAQPAFAVSRVGGGTLSNPAQGYTMSLPTAFPRSQVFPDDSVLLQPMFSVGFPSPILSAARINVLLLSTAYPDLSATDDREIVTSYFESRQWQAVQLSHRCLQAFTNQSATGYDVVVSWGGGHGILLAGTKEDSVHRAILQAVQSIELDAGACQWK
jgi:hypothetical protein